MIPDVWFWPGLLTVLLIVNEWLCRRALARAGSAAAAKAQELAEHIEAAKRGGL